VVKDPRSRKFFRFREAERFITERLDGETPLEVIRQRAEEQFGATLPAETLTSFVRNLGKNGLLETEGPGSGEHGGARRRISGSLLYLRLGIFDPSRLLDRLVPRVGFFFTRRFLASSAVLILLAIVTTIESWSELTQDLSRLYRLSAIPLFVVVLFLVGSAHELAHGATCTHFGGKVHETGFLLIYFQPALYCDVSDAWLFAEKAKRLWVGFAGPYFELFLWALATLAWRVTDVETGINDLALIVATSSGIKTLLNLNPLIKLDGYYLLSDYLEIPNLRRTSFRYLGSVIKGRLGLESPAAEEPSPRERKTYLAYGLLGSAASLSLLSYVLIAGASYLVENQQPEAVLISGGLLGMKFRRRFRRLFGAGDPSDPSDDEDFETEEAAGPREPGEPAEPKRDGGRAWKRSLVRTAWAGAIVGAAFLCHLDLRIAGPFNVLPRENADVRPAVGGLIAEVCVDEGDEVAAGDVVARLSDKDLLPELRKTEAEIKEARARLKLLAAGASAEEIQVAEAAVLRNRDQLQYAGGRLARSRTLFEQNLLSRTELEDMQALATTADNMLVEAQGRLKMLRSRTRPEEIEATAAQIERLEAQRRYFEEQREQLSILSPATGIVATPSRQLKEMNGQLVDKGDLIAKVYELRTVTAQIVISERDIADVRVGQEVVLRARAHPDQAFHGTVTYIATTAQGGSGPGQPGASSPAPSANPVAANRTVFVTTEIDNRSLLLKPEMTGQAKIYCGPRRVLDLLTRRLLRTLKVEVWSWW